MTTNSLRGHTGGVRNSRATAATNRKPLHANAAIGSSNLVCPKYPRDGRWSPRASCHLSGVADIRSRPLCHSRTKTLSGASFLDKRRVGLRGFGGTALVGLLAGRSDHHIFEQFDDRRPGGVWTYAAPLCNGGWCGQFLLRVLFLPALGCGVCGYVSLMTLTVPRPISHPDRHVGQPQLVDFAHHPGNASHAATDIPARVSNQRGSSWRLSEWRLRTFRAGAAAL